MWPCIIRVAERDSSRQPHHARRIALPVPLSPPHQRDLRRSSTPLPAHLRLRYGSRRNQPPSADATDGTLPHLHHHDLCSDLAARCLGTVCACGSSAAAADSTRSVMRPRFPVPHHPLAALFQRAAESLTTSLTADSAHYYQATARHFLNYL